MKVLTTEKLGIKEKQNDDSDTGLFLLNWFFCYNFFCFIDFNCVYGTYFFEYFSLSYTYTNMVIRKMGLKELATIIEFDILIVWLHWNVPSIETH